MMATLRFDEKAVDDVFAHLDQAALPGAAVAIAVAGTPVYRKGFGLASMELPVPLSPTIRMRIGSITKHFTALAYMLLCERGLAGLDDRIDSYVGGLPPMVGEVTMRQLMAHTSGIRDVLALSMFFNGTGRRVTDAEMVAFYRGVANRDFAPQEHWSYNNGGYILLTAAIERIAGEALDDLLHRWIFEPVGMHDTMLRRWDDDFVPNSATLHMLDATGRYSRDYMGMELSGVGGLVSTMDDMLRWLKHLDAPMVGSAATWALMKAPQRLATGAVTSYGFGLIRMGHRGLETLSHGGTVLGGGAQMMKIPALGLDIALAVNRADASTAELVGRVIDACVDGLPPVGRCDPPAMRSGLYVSPTSGRVVQLSTSDRTQFMSVDGGPPLPVAPDADGILQLPEAAAFMQQSLAISGRKLRFVEFGHEEVFDEVMAEPDALLGRFAGHYHARTLGIELRIADGAPPRMVTNMGHGSNNYTLRPLTATVWAAASEGPYAGVGAILFFTGGKTLSLTGSRMPHICFERTSD